MADWAGNVLIWSIRMVATGLIVLAFLRVLGLPEEVAALIKAIAWVGIAIGGVAPAWQLIGYAADGYRRRWVAPGYRETLLSLTTGVARFAVIIVALLILAEALAIPYQGVLAGLGIGGLAVALAAQPTLQNFLSGLTLYGDRPVSVGDFCRYGDKLGTIEHIGMRSTRLRSLDRTVVTVPNSEFVNIQLENFAHRDRIWLSTKLQLRYETTPDQLRYVLVELRKLLIAHPKVAPDPARVRFVGFGEHSLDIDIFAYVLTTDYNEFLAISEDIFLRMMALVEEAGTQFAVPSAVHYHAEDKAADAERVKRAEEEVARWRHGARLPFPDFPWQDKAELSGTLTYPPEGSSVAQEMQEWQPEDRPRREIGRRS